MKLLGTVLVSWTCLCLGLLPSEVRGRSTGPGCEYTNCQPAPKGGCTVKRYQACCEVWSCPDGMGGQYESFGISSGGGGFQQSSFSSPGNGMQTSFFSSSTGGGGGFDVGGFMKNIFGSLGMG